MFSGRHFLLFLVLILPAAAKATPADSLPGVKPLKTSIKYFYDRDFIYGNIIRYSVDTSPSFIHRVNPAMDKHHNFLSTLGSASVPQAKILDTEIFTKTSVSTYDLQMLHSDSIRSFRTNKRFTEIDYHNATFKEQRIGVTHTQNITRNLNAGLYFDRQGVKDFMNYSDTYRSRFAMFTWYNSPNRKYNIFARAFWNTIKNGVNGGLTSDSLFDNTVVTNVGIKGLAYQISEAEQHIRKKNFTVSHFFDLGKTEKDTLGNIIRRKPPLRLHHKVTLERKSFVYIDTDPDSNYYSEFRYGPNAYDSLHSDEFRNRFAIQFPSDSSYSSSFFRNWSSGVFTEYQYMNYGQQSDSSWNNISLGANVIRRTDSVSAELFSEAVYVVNGFDKENFHLVVKAYTPAFVFGRIGLQFKTSKSSPDLIYRWYDSNNFYWKNSFSKTNITETGVSYELARYRFKLELKHTILNNYVFLNKTAKPEQYNDDVSMDQIWIIKNFVYRFWHFDNTVVYQKSGNENIIHLPEWITDQALYFEKSYFKNALTAAFGVAFNYNSSYYADAYMPANSLFYYQDSTKTGGYPRFDLFVNTKIKTARIFLKLENALDGVFGDSYYLTPHYPMPGRVLKFGLVWQFFDQ
jgi:hypothetical protein